VDASAEQDASADQHASTDQDASADAPSLPGIDATPDSPATEAVRWHPGHYIWPSAFVVNNDNQGAIPAISSYLSGVCNDTHIKGLQVFFYWGAIEQTQGVYDFSLIDQVATMVGNCNKKLMVGIQNSDFASALANDPGQGNTDEYPPYILSSTYGACCGGQQTFAGQPYWQTGGVFYPTSANSQAFIRSYLNVASPAVMDNFVAMISAVAAHIDGMADVEMLTAFPETAFNVPIDSTAETAQVLRIIQAAATAAPHTVTRIGLNYTAGDSLAQQIIVACKASPTCIMGGPDPLTAAVIEGLQPAGFDQGPAIYRGIQCAGCTAHDYRPEVGWLVETQADLIEYQPNIGNDPVYGRTLPYDCDETVAAIRADSASALNAHYHIWTQWVQCYDPSGAQTGIIDSIDADDATNSTCPANFLSCNTN
jgi:hypothetical protein